MQRYNVSTKKLVISLSKNINKPDQYLIPPYRFSVPGGRPVVRRPRRSSSSGCCTRRHVVSGREDWRLPFLDSLRHVCGPRRSGRRVHGRVGAALAALRRRPGVVQVVNAVGVSRLRRLRGRRHGDSPRRRRGRSGGCGRGG